MKILMVKCHRKTIFSRIEPIVTEPLELEYLSALLENLHIEHRIYDEILEGKSLALVYEAYRPDVLLLTGYVTAVNVIIDYSQYAKKSNPKVKVIVGGVHGEINYQDFFVDSIDLIVHSDGLNTLEEVLKTNFDPRNFTNIKGIAYHGEGQWLVNDKIPTSIEKIPLPKRDYFQKYKHRTKYMNYSPVAIVKTALSCPHSCNFCYCKMLNGGIYSPRSIEDVVNEISTIDVPYIWIVDDSFLIDRERILHFIDEINKKGIRKKYIVYSRVDFIANNQDIIEQLGEIGLVEVIVGMEAVEDNILEVFNKNCTAYENKKAVEVLKKNTITLTALFIAGIDFTPRDFRRMRRWIRQMELESYTVSIFTPMKGTEHYKDYEDRILVKDFSKLDFLHLTMKPERMGIISFYMQFYYIYLEQFFRSKYIRNYLFRNFKNIFNRRGNNE